MSGNQQNKLLGGSANKLRLAAPLIVLWRQICETNPFNNQQWLQTCSKISVPVCTVVAHWSLSKAMKRCRIGVTVVLVPEVIESMNSVNVFSAKITPPHMTGYTWASWPSCHWYCIGSSSIWRPRNDGKHVRRIGSGHRRFNSSKFLTLFQFHQRRNHPPFECLRRDFDIGDNHHSHVWTALELSNFLMRCHKAGRLVHIVSKSHAKLRDEDALHTGGSLSSVSPITLTAIQILINQYFSHFRSQTMVLVFYLLCIVMMMLIRPWLNRTYLKNGKSAVYSALYFIPILALLHTVVGGLVCEYPIQLRNELSNRNIPVEFQITPSHTWA